MNNSRLGYVEVNCDDLQFLLNAKRAQCKEYFDDKTDETVAKYTLKTVWSWKHFKRIPLTRQHTGHMIDIAQKHDNDDYYHIVQHKRFRILNENIFVPLENSIKQSATGKVLINIDVLNSLMGDDLYL